MENRYSNRLFLLGLLVLLISACSTLPTRPYHGYREQGIASWYGKDFHGRPTASGEIYNMYRLTAAHRLLPLGTIARVTNLRNGKSVVVKINDRGPFVDGRIIDLSYKAALRLGMVEEGLAPVEIRILKWGTKAGDFTVQVGSFLVRENAMRVLRHLRKRYKDVYIITYTTNDRTFYRVRVGSTRDIRRAEIIASQLNAEGFSPFITRKD